ncbi:hypothetical protein [Aureivirga sp. CE67]|uniref:hypothetical protein n=1 Tax=Aureivirga sp. CE67 TaxID=1788983 RepID=UPI0018CAD0AE|nr:hypothetical protein [Aureivirga sp. CE67]
MNKQEINKNVTIEDLNLIYEAIDKNSNNLNKIATSIFELETKEKVFAKPSHYIFSIIHRAIELNRGFRTLVDNNNWITANNLIRLQADCCMRAYALALVNDKVDFYNKITNNVRLNSIKDVEGNKMTDFYLSEKLNLLYPGFRLIYSNTSGFIHFSNEHLNFNTETNEKGENFIMKIRISEPSNLDIFKKVDYAYNMLFMGQKLHRILKGYELYVKKIMDNLD